MKRIINGKKYDTETADLIGERDNGYYGDAYYIEEKLYQKKTGEFFLYGYGGPFSAYGEECGNRMWTDSSKIVPYTIEEAKAWVAKYLSVTIYEKLFGEIEE